MNIKNITCFIFILFTILILKQVNAQNRKYPDNFLSPAFHKDRREQLRQKMPPNSVAVFFSNPTKTRSNDVDYPYHQDPDFYYLSGYREPNAVLLIFKDFQKDDKLKDHNEVIFVRPNNQWEELWNGKRLGIDGVRNQLGFENVFANTDFGSYDPDYRKFNKILFKPVLDDFSDTEEKGDLYDLLRWFKLKAGIKDSATMPVIRENLAEKFDDKLLPVIMAGLREIKTEDELVLLRKAILISCAGQAEVMKAVYPGISERSIQGIHELVHDLGGAEEEGYPPIVGAGNNTCTLHYEENSRSEIDSGELILMDVGAEYRGYSADVTRTIPVNGTFSPEQKLIYQLVYDAEEATIKICKAGIKSDKLDDVSREIITEGLKKLEIIKKSSESFYYYPHGVSHPIGLDVHDAGETKTIEENMVVTIEPGIYIPEGSPCDPKWWKTGIRIEDDVLVGKSGCEVLSDSAPRKIEDIESKMAEPSVLGPFLTQLKDRIK
jgi:Xaa-Pro aminopeptidase